MASLRMPIRNIGTDRISKIQKPVSLKDFCEKRNKLAIIRHNGGLGDLLMHRMIFEDFKLLLPEIETTFAVPQGYFSSVEDHPFIDKIVDCNTINADDFFVSYVTSTACGKYENKMAPFADKHRSDIWAEHCGINLTKHSMHFNLTKEEKEFGKTIIEKVGKGKKVALLCPISAMESKNLDYLQINGIIKGLWDLDYVVAILHYVGIEKVINVPVLSGLKIRQYFGVIDACDGVISVDTSSFHCAGGMGKPLVGVYSWADGLVYGKYYDFELVQRHRDYTCGWTCGPCFNWHDCPKNRVQERKPCITEITAEEVVEAFKRAVKIT